VVKQAELYFAVPYSTLDKIEGVCSRMPAPHSLGEKYLALIRKILPLLGALSGKYNELSLGDGWPKKEN